MKTTALLALSATLALGLTAVRADDGGLEDMAHEAAAEWGWRGMEFDVHFVTFKRDATAEAIPSADRRSCVIRLDTAHWEMANEAQRKRRLVHEVGHCIGAEHSELPWSVMFPYYIDGQEILPEDHAHVVAVRLPLLSRVVVSGVAR